MGEAFTISVASTDERDELTPAQQVLNAALELNEAVYELMALAQQPDMLARLVAGFAKGQDAGATSHDDADPPFAEAVDKIASALCDLHHTLGEPLITSRLADAAQRWVRGED